MAGDWIAIDKTLPMKPEIGIILRSLKVSRAEAVLGCLRVWFWADGVCHAGGVTGASLDDVDAAAQMPGFGQAMIAAGWLLSDPGGITFPNWGRWNANSAKARLQKNRRQARWREGNQQ